jgi:hypothetical protein
MVKSIEDLKFKVSKFKKKAPEVAFFYNNNLNGFSS